MTAMPARPALLLSLGLAGCQAIAGIEELHPRADAAAPTNDGGA